MEDSISPFTSSLLLPIGIFGNPSRSTKHRREQFDRVSEEGHVLSSLSPSSSARKLNLLMHSSILSSCETDLETGVHYGEV